MNTPSNHTLPWQSRRSKSSTGSGFVIQGQRIITNAHVVADNTFVAVRKLGCPTKYTAKVVAIGHECDLALLEVDNETFWEGVVALEFGDLPQLQDTVHVLGYPTGGDNLSVTRGIVSRLEPQQYAHMNGTTSLLAIQIDGAINPGNSGGPVFVGEAVVGVAFQNLVGAENIGFIIPTPVVNHFLKDVDSHGRFTGFGSLGITALPLENHQLRRYFRMQEHHSGVLVSHILPLSKAADTLKRDDVLMSVDGVPIANDGTIRFRGIERIFFDYLFVHKFVGDSVRCRVLRDAKEKEVDVVLSAGDRLVPPRSPLEYPSYFVYAGLVFVRLTQSYLMEFGEEWWNHCPRSLLQLAIHGQLQYPDEEVVVLSHVLVDEANYGYDSYAALQLIDVNNTKVRNMQHLIEMVESGDDEFVRFNFEQAVTLAFDRKKAVERSSEILTKHRVAFDRSPELR